jgi:glycine cleavage system aminomethyltransferase T
MVICRACNIDKHVTMFYERYNPPARKFYRDSKCAMCSQPRYVKKPSRYDLLTNEEKNILADNSINQKRGAHLLNVCSGTFKKYRIRYLREVAEDAADNRHSRRVQAATDEARRAIFGPNAVSYKDELRAKDQALAQAQLDEIRQRSEIQAINTLVPLHKK